MKHISAGVLDVAYEEAGAADGTPVFLMHGFPYDVHAFDEVTPLLVARGCRVIASSEMSRPWSLAPASMRDR